MPRAIGVPQGGADSFELGWIGRAEIHNLEVNCAGNDAEGGRRGLSVGGGGKTSDGWTFRVRAHRGCGDPDRQCLLGSRTRGGSRTSLASGADRSRIGLGVLEQGGLSCRFGAVRVFPRDCPMAVVLDGLPGDQGCAVQAAQRSVTDPLEVGGTSCRATSYGRLRLER